MRRLLWLVALLLVLDTPVLAAEGAPFQPLPDAAQEARARALQKELRCPVCEVQSIDESNAPLAADLRKLIRDRIAAGESDEEIKDYLVERYGAFILMRPPVRTDTYFLWFAPILLLIAGAGIVAVTVARARRRPDAPTLESEAERTHH
jgi:cytochrome c-type biogenesis protein CcmH